MQTCKITMCKCSALRMDVTECAVTWESCSALKFSKLGKSHVHHLVLQTKWIEMMQCDGVSIHPVQTCKITMCKCSALRMCLSGNRNCRLTGVLNTFFYLCVASLPTNWCVDTVFDWCVAMLQPLCVCVCVCVCGYSCQLQLHWIWLWGLTHARAPVWS